MYNDYREHMRRLPETEVGRLVLALLDYSQTGVLPELTGETAMAFSFMRLQIDRDREKWEETRRRRSDAGKKSADRRMLHIIEPKDDDGALM
jgi:hypothetical protein